MADRGQEYVCSKGHALYDPEGKLRKCLGYSHGSPCKGKLTATGGGAVAANKRLRAQEGIA